MVSAPVRIRNFKYSYDPYNNTIQPGDYESFPTIMSSSELIKATEPINKDTGFLDETYKVRLEKIELCVPILNYALAGKDGNLLRKILGIKNNVWTDIIECKYGIDLKGESGELVKVSDASMSSRMLIGTRLIAKYIQDFDIQQAIEDEIIFSIVDDNLTSSRPAHVLPNVAQVTHSPGENDIQIIGDYYVHINEELFNVYKKRGRNIRSIEETRNNILLKFNSRLSLLINLPSDKSSLMAMIAPFVIVIPYEMRASLEGELKTTHPLTKAYEAIMQANSDMIAFYKNDSTEVQEYRIRLRELTRVVNEVYYEHINKKTLVDESILGKLATKGGQIRKFNLGRRQDYSARAVVTVDPYLPLDQLNVPEEMLPKLYEYHILPYIPEKLELAKNEDIKGINKDFTTKVILTREDVKLLANCDITSITSKEPAKVSVMRKLMLQIIYEHHMLDNIPMYLGRQPTLHKHSFQAFRIGVSNTQAFQVTPLICPGFNMDFDGDAGYVNVPLGKEAIKDVNELMMPMQNIYLAKNSESTIEPRQDMLYGLYMCTRNVFQNHPDAATIRYEFRGVNDATGTTDKRERLCITRNGVELVNKPILTTIRYSDGPADYHNDYYVAYYMITNNLVAVWDRITVHGYTMTVGDAAFLYCFQKDDVQPRNASSGLRVTEISNKNISQYITHILRQNGDTKVYQPGIGNASPNTFIGSINHMVYLGFKVAQYYPPNISLVDAVKPLGNYTAGKNDKSFTEGLTMNYDNIITQFYDSIKDADFLYNIGLDTIDTYREIFSTKVHILDDAIKNHVFDSLYKFGEKPDNNENGYYTMAVSGGRGSAGSARQIFKYKGQIQKDENQSFDAIIEHGYADQLTPFEQFINAYGGRQGQMDKSLKTGDTGYAMRRMWHATQGYVITSHDCGDTEGIELNYSYFNDHFTDDSPSEIMTSWLVGHYMTDGNHPLTYEEAVNYTEESRKYGKSFRIRSPLTCKNPCCARCYGVDPATHKTPIIGLNVGIIAAQSIGEPATQLTMKQFQKGGVASANNVTSAFDRVQACITMKDLTSNYAGYDPIAWDDGEVHSKASVIPGMKEIWIGNNDKRTIRVSTHLNTTAVAKKGVGLSATRGDYDMKTLIYETGVDNAQKYLAAKLFALYLSEVKISFQHLEILAASLARYLILKTTRTKDEYDSTGRLISKRLMLGHYATAQEYFTGSTQPTDVTAIKNLISVKDVIQASNDALDEVQMENLGRGISHISAMNMTDSFTKPLNRMLLSHTILTGSSLPNFRSERHVS